MVGGQEGKSMSQIKSELAALQKEAIPYAKLENSTIKRITKSPA